MPSPDDNASMALFCDFENVALGVRDAKYDKFDIKRVLERLLLKGSIVVKKAYCDWERYKAFKAPMHEASFELIEIPHVRQSGKNSADIRLVVDALDLCYTKSHVNTFVIISGDSDFSPLVSKLRENNKKVIGVGVKQSTSDLLIANCDEFIFYDDLVRESQRAAAKRQTSADSGAQARRTPDEDRRRKDDVEARRTLAIEIAVETFEALASERGDAGKIWASVLKEAIKRRKPDFNENYFGFRAFGNLLEEAQSRGLLKFGRDERSGAYVYRDLNDEGSSRRVDSSVSSSNSSSSPASAPAILAADRDTSNDAPAENGEGRRSRGSRSPSGRRARGSSRRDQTAEVVAALDQLSEPAFAAPADSAAESHSGAAPVALAIDSGVARSGSAELAAGVSPAAGVPATGSPAAGSPAADSFGPDGELAKSQSSDSQQGEGAAAPRKTAKRPSRRAGKKPAEASVTSDNEVREADAAVDAKPEASGDTPPAKPARKTPARPRRPRKSATTGDA